MHEGGSKSFRCLPKPRRVRYLEVRTGFTLCLGSCFYSGNAKSGGIDPSTVAHYASAMRIEAVFHGSPHYSTKAMMHRGTGRNAVKALEHHRRLPTKRQTSKHALSSNALMQVSYLSLRYPHTPGERMTAWRLKKGLKI